MAVDQVSKSRFLDFLERNHALYWNFGTFAGLGATGADDHESYTKKNIPGADTFK
jgi:hypothetical protein